MRKNWHRTTAFQRIYPFLPLCLEEASNQGQRIFIMVAFKHEYTTVTDALAQAKNIQLTKLIRTKTSCFQSIRLSFAIQIANDSQNYTSLPIPNPKASWQPFLKKLTFSKAAFVISCERSRSCISNNNNNKLIARPATFTSYLTSGVKGKSNNSPIQTVLMWGHRERRLFFVVWNWQVVSTWKLLQLFTTSSSLLSRLAETTTLAPCLTQWCEIG